MTWRLLFLTLILCLSSSLAYARFTLTPGVDLSVEYDDNIFLDDDNEQDDVITTVSPNVNLTWETARLDVSMYASVISRTCRGSINLCKVRSWDLRILG